MRIIYIRSDIKKYINPTLELIHNGICDLDEVYKVDISGLSSGATVTALVHKHGPFDLILMRGGFFFHHGIGNSHVTLPDLFDCGIPIMVLHLADDLHGWKLDHVYAFDRLHKTGAFVLSTAASSQFFMPFNNDMFNREAWLPRDCFIAHHPEVITNNERYLMFPHAIDEAEFIPVDWGKKKYDVSVMGVQYYFRRRIIEHLEKTRKYKFKTKKDFIQQVASFLLGRSSMVDKIYKSRFIDIISKSVASVTCAGSVGYPVRKFFEIPAFGAVLMAEFFHEARALGFIDRENCFYLHDDSAGEMDEIIDTLISDSSMACQITEAGQEMVRENHSVSARMQHFRSIAEAVADGTLKTTLWEGGKQKLIRNE